MEWLLLAALTPLAWLNYGLSQLKPNVFVRMLDGKMRAKFIFEDEKVVVLKDIFPAAEHHLLVVPREKIHAWTSLKGSNHKELVEHMLKIGKEVLAREGGDPDSARFGFMTPPFNTQMQLHLHVLSQPLTIGGVRGFALQSSKFVTPEEVINQLSKM